MHAPHWSSNRNAVGVFGLLLLLSLSGCRRDAGSSREDAPAQAVVPPTDTFTSRRLAALDSGLTQIEAGLRTSPRDRWDPAYVVARIGKDPTTLTSWVRDSTAWIPYRGLLRGAVGVLMDRDGNGLDRALLLAKLLQLAGHDVRLAHARLNAGLAADMLPDLVARRQLTNPTAALVPAEATTVSLTSASPRGAADPAPQIVAAEDRAARGVYAELDRRVRDQTARLVAMAKAPDPRRDWGRRRAAALDALQDHWWVQRREGDRWLDHDPLAADGAAAPAAGATPETVAPEDIPEGLRHRIAVRVIAEDWSRGKLSERSVLEHTLQPADLNGRAIVLQIWPTAWPAELHRDPASDFGLRGAALEQHAWSVALTLDGQPAAEGQLTDGEKDEKPVAGGPLGGLGGAILNVTPGRSEGGGGPSRVLTSAWIEYQLLAPDAPPRTIRRAVFDLLGPSVRAKGASDSLVLNERQRLTRSLALMIRTEILPVAQRMAPQYALHLMMERLVANRALLRQLAASPETERPPDSALATGTPPLSALYSLAYARIAWSPVGNRVFVDRLGLLTQHRHPALMGNQFGMRGAFDVAAGDIGVSLAVRDAFPVRLRQGVLDSNAEGLWWSGVASLNTGEVFGESKGWTALTPAEQEPLTELALPDDTRWRIGQDLAAGLTVVAPTAPVPVDDERYVGWWRIDPATGSTRGVSGNGWGQCNAEFDLLAEEDPMQASEYGVNIRTVAWAYARGLWREFWLCQAIAQSINGSRTIAAELQKRKLWFWWMPPINASDPKSVFIDNAKTCLVSAMAAGFLATMPILLMAARTEELLAAARIAAAERDAAAQAAEAAGAGRRTFRPSGGAPDVDPLGKTRPGADPLGETQRGADPLGETQRGADPLGKTEPGLGKTQDLSKTQPEVKTTPGSRPTTTGDAEAPTQRQPRAKPTSQVDAEAKEREAYKKWRPLQDESSNRTGDWLRENMKAGLEPEGEPGEPGYHPGRPPDPDFNPDLLDELEAKMNQANATADRALKDLIEARDNVEWAQKAVRKGEIPFNEPHAPAPEPTGCPPNCDNGSSGSSGGEAAAPSSGEQMVGGSASVSSSFYPYSWSQ
jgi:hypothetical protein